MVQRRIGGTRCWTTCATGPDRRDGARLRVTTPTVDVTHFRLSVKQVPGTVSLPPRRDDLSANGNCSHRRGQPAPARDAFAPA